MSKYKIFIGGSAGSIMPIISILSSLPIDFKPTITIVVHSNTSHKALMPEVVANCCALKVVEVADKEEINSNTVYVAPCGYHLYVESKASYSLSIDKKEHFSRPAIDLLFTSAAEVFGQNCIAILLSGANEDGAEGLLNIKRLGGLTIVQSPLSAHDGTMPQSAINKGAATKALTPVDIAKLLLQYDIYDKS